MNRGGLCRHSQCCVKRRTPLALRKPLRSRYNSRPRVHGASSCAYPGDGPLQLLAARAYTAQNRQMLSHLHQGEYYPWQGNLKGAIDQLENASKASLGD